MKTFDISVISTPYKFQPSNTMGSVEKVSFQRFQKLTKMGYNVNFIAPVKSKLDEDYKYYPIKKIRVDSIPNNRSKLHWLYSTGSFNYFSPYMKIPENEIGQILIFDGWRLEPWDFIPLAMKFHKSTVINILHPPVVFVDKTPIKMFQLLYKRAIWGSLNTRISEYMRKLGYNVIYLPNGIAIPSERMIMKEPENFFIFFGRIEPVKAPHLAIMLSKSTKKPLKIFGKIYDQSYFNKMIKPYIDGVQIKFYGEVPYDILFDNLRRSSATFYFSYSYDPFPTVLLESLSYGVPVIGNSLSPLSGFHDLIVPKMNGNIVKVNEIADKLSYNEKFDIFSNFDRTLIYRNTSLKWSWKNVIKKFYEPFLSTLGISPHYKI